MSNSGVEALGRVPPSAALGATLQRSADYARHQSHRRVTLEHLLLALCDDPDAARVLAASRVDVRQIMIDASGFVGRIDDRSPPGQPVEPVLDGELARILEYATVAAQQSGRREINGAIVLAAIVGDERSAAATMLRSQGLTFDEAITVLRQTARQPGDAPPTQPPPQAAQRSAPAPSPPQPAPQLPSTAQILADVRTRIEAGSAVRAAPAWAGANPTPSQSRSPEQPAWAAPNPQQPAPTWPSAWQQPAAPATYQPQAYQQPQAPADQGAQQGYGQQAPQPYAYPPEEYGAGISMPSYSEPPPPQSYAPPQPPVQSAPRPASRPQTQPQSPPDAQRDDRRTQPPRRGKSQAAPAQTQAVLPLTGVDPEQLERMLPDSLTREVPEVVEIRVARADLTNLGVALGSGPGAARPELIVSRSLTVRLRSPDGRATVEPVTPETQWIERDDGYLTADDVAWRWTVTGRRRGAAALQLSVTARTVALDGLPVDSALPDQTHEVRVSTNWLRFGGRVALIAAAVVVGMILAMSGSMIFDLMTRVARRG